MDPLPPLTACRLSDLPSTWWLDVSCVCPGHRPTSLPLSGLATRAGPQAPLLGVAQRLRCVSCRSYAARVILADQPSYPPGSSVAPAATFAMVLIGDDPSRPVR